MKFQKKIKLMILMILLSSGMGQAIAQVKVTDLVPARELTDDSVLEPGLLPIYIYKSFRHIDEMPFLNPKTTTEKVGKPILFLNHHFGEKDLIFDSGVRQGIGIQMNGFLKFSEAGIYGMRALSNDGIRVEICSDTILMDPRVHSDRFSRQAVLDIPKPGWYPIMIQYFQRVGTATIEMQWKLPGKTDFSVIPAEAYSHEPVSKGPS
ncbi:MAG: PA14 domain-containing protein [Deltaproteobacteria bacterium]|nr:PA14 domain-containing protein [Deltaproteobacteria bacterium]